MKRCEEDLGLFVLSLMAPPDTAHFQKFPPLWRPNWVIVTHFSPSKLSSWDGSFWFGQWRRREVVKPSQGDWRRFILEIWPDFETLEVWLKSRSCIEWPRRVFNSIELNSSECTRSLGRACECVIIYCLVIELILLPNVTCSESLSSSCCDLAEGGPQVRLWKLGDWTRYLFFRLGVELPRHQACSALWISQFTAITHVTETTAQQQQRYL